ncbi:hypothetical protein [Polyangium jinanense]|uniref:Uncharacterized protein n=1 Tax=Polyangium jinanense TaxID=2829994 RepID=A0A9X4APA2_9BACT|nr:hypothetical protein [Polyangium jinanense]MDC3953793.1 hypothetical protein [Polyangium jinanense]MDC3979086.1 hypothetical protein [Polyangium jinanense]
MSGGMSGGHFLGFYVAVLGLMALVVALDRPRVAARLGNRRLPVGLAGIVLLVALAFFGSGSRRITLRPAVGPSSGLPARLTQAHVDAALARATSPAFVAYVAAVCILPPLDHPERLGARLSARHISGFDLPNEGIRVSPPPKIGDPWILVSYDDTENAVLAAFDGGEGMRRMQVVQCLAMDVLPELVVIEALRAAPTDAEKIEILRGQTLTVPRTAEFLARALDDIAASASPALKDVIAAKRAYVQKYLDDPTMRGLPPGTRLSLPEFSPK